ncbi:hypothetical protein CBS101457_002131 [Exobasidium rhododendri]|nr:hypothetical protein CBS101457_002131 [Exobasidium rhododendri]
MVAVLRSLAGGSRSVARMTSIAQPLPRTIRTSAYRMNDSPKKSTHSEDAVHAEKHDLSPEELQKKTANDAKKKHDTTPKSSSPNDIPTGSEDSVHADRHAHDPLPDHKKKSAQ